MGRTKKVEATTQVEQPKIENKIVETKIIWDVPIGTTIEYFDPYLSYELTGYRPINDEQGLDFNPDWFREDALNKLKTGVYSKLIPGTKSHKDFWKERQRRCIEGITVNGYRITGDNYFWLNFYRLKQAKKGAKASAGRQVSFPMFFVFQYEYFHYVEMCEILGKDVGLLKARSMGFSEMAASLCARPFITTPDYRVVASAYSEKHLKPLLAKVWAQLDWLAEETETGFKRVRMAVNTAMHKRASKKDKDGREFGHMSEIEGMIIDDPQKLRGDRTERLFFEEGGSDKILVKKYLQAEALITVMGQRIGTRIVWGTGGDEGVALEGIQKITTNPQGYNILPFKNIHTPDQRPILSAMFIPCYRLVLNDEANLVDSRGWCNLEEGRKFFERKRETLINDPKALLIYKAEYCFTIEEALIQQGDNMFPREELAEQQAAITIYNSVPKPEVGNLVWDTVLEGNDRVRTGKVSWRKDPNGKILMLEPPITSADGLSYKNLYVGGIDSIDIGKDDSSSDDGRASDFCGLIKKRAFGQDVPRYVAMYKDRPRDVREAYDTMAKLLIFYGAKAVLESTRTAILTYFRDKKFLHLLMKRPRSTMPDISKGNSDMYGAPATVKTIVHYRELIYDFVIDYCFTIGFLEMINQLLNYSDEKKKDFDIVAAMGMCELGDEELSVRKPTTEERTSKEFRDIGWYKDGRGYKHYGVIPKTEQEKNAKNRIRTEDSWLYKDNI